MAIVDRSVHLSDQGFFWLGVELEEAGYGSVVDGTALYVEYQIPVNQTQPYPLVMIHGGGAQGLDWCGTPDGRPGWRTMALQRGYAVYVVDRPGHGRAGGRAPGGSGPTVEGIGAVFAGVANPAATQWPTTGRADDEAIATMLAGAAGAVPAHDIHHQIMRQRGAQLLDRIGPAVIIANSAGSASAWLMADARPADVRAIVAIEPLGPSMSWGIAEAPLTFDPPIDDLNRPRFLDSAEGQTLSVPEALFPFGPPPLWIQAEPACALVNLADIPVAVVTGEASFAMALDPATVAFLRQAGCPAEHLLLGDFGVMGNGHLPMLELNNAEVLDVVCTWIERVTTSATR